jgi:hypothetical protein
MNERKTKIPEPALTYQVRERGPHALKGPCPTCRRDPCAFAFFDVPHGWSDDDFYARLAAAKK